MWDNGFKVRVDVREKVSVMACGFLTPANIPRQAGWSSLIQGKVSMQEGGLTCKGPFQPKLGDHSPAKSLGVGEQHIRALIQLGRRGQEKGNEVLLWISSCVPV